MNDPSPAPRIHRFRIGDWPAFVVSDGPLELGPPPVEFDDLPADTVTALARSHGLPADRMPLEQNALLVIADGKPVLFDTGTGPVRPFGPHTGRLAESLALAGFEPGDIEAVVLTHGHSDHLWGLMAADGQPAYENATVHIAAEEYAFVTAATATGDFADRHRAVLAACAGKVRRFAVGAEVVPGIVAVASPGHTVGHTCYRIGKGSEAILVLGDLLHHPMLAERPDLTYRYDFDRSLTVASRRAVLAQCAADGSTVLGYHFPWPGLGRIAAAGDGYAFRAF